MKFSKPQKATLRDVMPQALPNYGDCDALWPKVRGSEAP